MQRGRCARFLFCSLDGAPVTVETPSLGRPAWELRAVYPISRILSNIGSYTEPNEITPVFEMLR